MDTLEKLEQLTEYMVGQTYCPEPEKQYMACAYEQSAVDHCVDEGQYNPELIVLYASTVKEVIELAYEREKMLNLI